MTEMTQMSEFVFIATERQLKVTTDPAFIYEPAPFHGTSAWVKVTQPSKADPFKRFRDGQ